jgi:acetylornithine deacetylase/succinyl-diaminopimelate desuccinylase-like protein
MTGTRDGAIARAEKYFDEGSFLEELQRRVAIPTTSQEQGSMPALQEYVSGEMTESLQKLGYDCTVLPNPRSEYGPLLIGRRVEDPALPTVLMYGHGDVIRGQDASVDLAARARGPWHPTATACTAAAPPTTRASTASTSPRWRRCWHSAGGWASTSPG